MSTMIDSEPQPSEGYEGPPPTSPTPADFEEVCGNVRHVLFRGEPRKHTCTLQKYHEQVPGNLRIHSDGEMNWDVETGEIWSVNARRPSLVKIAAPEIPDALLGAPERIEPVEEAKVDPDPFPGYVSLGIAADASFPAMPAPGAIFTADTLPRETPARLVLRRADVETGRVTVTELGHDPECTNGTFCAAMSAAQQIADIAYSSAVAAFMLGERYQVGSQNFEIVETRAEL